MLSNLLIKNYALIKHLEMQPSQGLNIITGETGAGKSIMLGAIGLLMGKRADTKVLLHKDQKCVIEGTFSIQNYSLQSLFEEHDWEYETQTIIRREISAAGKSRAFINDSPVNLDALRLLGKYLLDVHSQNDTLKLGGQQFQINILDIYGQNDHILKRYREIFLTWNTLKKEHLQLQKRSAQQQKESDYKNFLLEELEAMMLDHDEQMQLEESLQLMEHAEEIKIQIQNSLQALSNGEYSASELLSQASQMWGRIREYAISYQSLHNRLESTLIELKDIVEEIHALDQQIEHNPAAIESTKSRLDSIYRLQKKHGVQTVKELLEIKEQLVGENEQLSHLDDTLKKMEHQIQLSESQLMKLGAELSDQRKNTFPHLKKQLEVLLSQLGMPDSRLEMTSAPAAPGPNGLDDINWLFSANKGITPQPINKVASGGEFSRLMFCVKYLIAGKVALPTILFDEIDTGISGEVALQMIEMMYNMATNHQVLTISHLPQFAARGDHHYYVYKESDENSTTSGIRKLADDERVEEIAKMLGGNKPSEIAYANAKELMQPSN